VSAATSNKLSILIAPLLVIAASYFAMPYANALPDVIASQIHLAPYLIYFAAIVLGALYSRHRVAMLALIMGIAYWALHSFVGLNLHTDANAKLVYASVGVLMPISVAAIATLQERRMLSMQGVLTFGVVMGLLLLTIWLLKNFPDMVNLVLLSELISDSEFLRQTPVPQTVLLIYLLSTLVLLALFFNKKTVFESSFFASLIASFLGLHTGMAFPEISLYMSLSGVLLVGAMVHNAYSIAYMDDLTELPGRRALNEELARMRGTYSIAMLDVDHFKKFNDTYGHDVGDQVLRMVSAKMRNVGGGGKPFRYGGEEFAILFSGKNCKSAFPHLSNLRETIDKTHMILRQKPRPKEKPDIIPKKPRRPWQEVHVTISIGVAEKTEEFSSPEEVIKAADKALYRSKEKGRNRISQYGLDFTPPSDAKDGNAPVEHF
jgi:diguanylate cyclase (GGDEF)-like protein